MIEKPFGHRTEETEHDSTFYSIVNAALNGPAVARLSSTSINRLERSTVTLLLKSCACKWEAAFSIREHIIAKFYDDIVKLEQSLCARDNLPIFCGSTLMIVFYKDYFSQ